MTGAGGQSYSAIKIVDDMILEGPGLRLDALVAPERIFSRQRGWFADAHACDAAFGLSPAQAAMGERYDTGLRKIMPTFQDMPPDRVKERLQGEAQGIASRLQSKSMTPRDLVDEVHACERRFGLPVSDIKVN